MARALVALVFALVAVPAAAGSRPKVAVLDVKSVQGVAPGTATILTSIIAGDTARAGFDVLSQSDIAALIGFERQKQMLGCGDDSSCLAEIGGALGAQYVLYTQVGQIGSRIHISLQLLDARKGVVVGRVSTFSKSNEDALAETAEGAVAEVLAAARARAEAVAVPEKPPIKSPAAFSSSRDAEARVRPEEVPSSLHTTPSGADGALVTRASWRSRHQPYVEARVGLEATRVPLPNRDTRDVGATGAGLSLAAGFHWKTGWMLELDAGFVGMQTNDFNVRHSSALLGERDFGARAHVKRIFASAGAVWAPRANRYLAVAADVGIASMRYSYEEFTHPGTSYSGITLADPADASSLAPLIGVELRLEYPTRWFTAGGRLGMVAVHNGVTGTSNWFDGTSIGSFTWLEPRWLLPLSGSLFVRYTL